MLVTLKSNIAKSVEQSPSSEADSSLGSQKFPCSSWNPTVHYRIYKRPSLLRIFSHMNPLHAFSFYFFLKSVIILSYYLHLGLSSATFPSGFPTKILYAPLLHTRHMSHPSNFFDCITRIIFGDECKL